MAEYSLPLEAVLDGLNIPQVKLLLEQRERRLALERRWQLLVASLPLQKESGDFFSTLMESLESIASGEVVSEGGAAGAGVWQPPKSAPLLHKITPQVAKMMRVPIHFVEKQPEQAEENNGEHQSSRS